jgi:hypothetical protein
MEEAIEPIEPRYEDTAEPKITSPGEVIARSKAAGAQAYWHIFKTVNGSTLGSREEFRQVLGFSGFWHTTDYRASIPSGGAAAAQQRMQGSSAVCRDPFCRYRLRLRNPRPVSSAN